MPQKKKKKTLNSCCSKKKSVGLLLQLIHSKKINKLAMNLKLKKNIERA
jgi:hypothetical protein